MRLMRICLAAAVGLTTVFGCAYSTHSGLPAHIKTIEVNSFRNRKTMYKGLESKLTKRLRELAAQDPQVKLVNTGGDAVLCGEIVDASQQIYRETTKDQPASVLFTITVCYSFSDEVEQKVLVKDAKISSAQSNSTAGLYEKDRGELRASVEDDAIDNLAKEIIRATLGKW